MEFQIFQRRKSLLSRKLAVKNTDPCGDVLLDEALKHMKETEYPESIQVSEVMLMLQFPCYLVLFTYASSDELFCTT